jgi:hypothetical protein
MDRKTKEKVAAAPLPGIFQDRIDHRLECDDLFIRSLGGRGVTYILETVVKTEILDRGIWVVKVPRPHMPGRTHQGKVIDRCVCKLSISLHNFPVCYKFVSVRVVLFHIVLHLSFLPFKGEVALDQQDTIPGVKICRYPVLPIPKAKIAGDTAAEKA